MNIIEYNWRHELQIRNEQNTQQDDIFNVSGGNFLFLIEEVYDFFPQFLRDFIQSRVQASLLFAWTPC